MKMPSLIIALVLMTACTPEEGEPPTNVTDTATPPVTPAALPPAESEDALVAPVGSDTGTIKSIDLGTNSITIDHGSIEVLSWPPMTTTFPAPDVDLASFKPGDEVKFEVTAQATIVSITPVQPTQ